MTIPQLKQNFTFYRGYASRVQWVLRDGDGPGALPIDMTNGTAGIRLSPRAGDPVPLYSRALTIADGPGGVMELLMSAQETTALEARSHYYEVWAAPEGEEPEPVAIGAGLGIDTLAAA